VDLSAVQGSTGDEDDAEVESVSFQPLDYDPPSRDSMESYPTPPPTGLRPVGRGVSKSRFLLRAMSPPVWGIGDRTHTLTSGVTLPRALDKYGFMVAPRTVDLTIVTPVGAPEPNIAVRMITEEEIGTQGKDAPWKVQLDCGTGDRAILYQEDDLVTLAYCSVGIDEDYRARLTTGLLGGGHATVRIQAGNRCDPRVDAPDEYKKQVETCVPTQRDYIPGSQSYILAKEAANLRTLMRWKGLTREDTSSEQLALSSIHKELMHLAKKDIDTAVLMGMNMA